jgi:hypothetical protein
MALRPTLTDGLPFSWYTAAAALGLGNRFAMRPRQPGHTRTFVTKGYGLAAERTYGWIDISK